MILVSGAGGQLASLIIAKAKESGLGVIGASRGADADRFMDFDRRETLDFSGIETLFLTSAGYAEDDQVISRHGAAIEAARAHGVKHVVYSSLSRASDHLGFALAHRWTERALERSGMRWTLLRNGLYAELIGALASPRDGRISLPFGEGKVSAVARVDLAEAAVAVLRDLAAHEGACYELSGIKAFGLSELARTLGVSYAPSSLAEERARLATLPLLPFQPPMLMSICSAAMTGFLETEGTDLRKLVASPQDALGVATGAARTGV